jgi:hypothetical protein
MLTRRQSDTFDGLSPSALKAVHEAAEILLTIEAMMCPTASPDGIRSGKPESRPPGDIRAATAHRRVLGRLWAAVGHSRRDVNVLTGKRVDVPAEYRKGK